MAVVAKRFLDQGISIEETAKLIQHPVEFVKAVSSGGMKGPLGT